VKIAIPMEVRPDEHRVALDPESCRKLIQLGIEVTMEPGAGAGAFFPDAAYLEAGVGQVADPARLLGEADFVVKVGAPGVRPDGRQETDLMRPGAMLLASLFPTRHLEAVTRLAERGITAFSTDCIPRTTRAQAMDTLSSQANIVGYKGVLLGAVALPKYFPMLMTAAGTTLQAKVFVIGAGVAGCRPSPPPSGSAPPSAPPTCGPRSRSRSNPWAASTSASNWDRAPRPAAATPPNCRPRTRRLKPACWPSTAPRWTW